MNGLRLAWGDDLELLDQARHELAQELAAGSEPPARLRIDLGRRAAKREMIEIESRLRQHPAVREAVVLVTAEAGEPSLMAYVVPHAEKPAVEALRHHLTTALPEYMIPAQFVLLASLPLTPNGKIDHVALQHYRDEVDASEPAFVPPRTPTEHEVEGIWTELMKLDQISVHTNFF